MFVCPACGRLAQVVGYCPADGEGLIARTDELQGQSVGSYRITREIGRGGMGQVYQGVHPSIGSRVAIKILSRECLEHPELVQRFFDEARAVNLIRHEGIVNVLDLAHLSDGRPYIVMEYLDGHTLRVVLAGQRTAFDAVVRVLSEVLYALEAAHSKGIVHRDLKPDNIFVTPAGRAKVLDFGIAKLRPELTGQRAATRVGVVFGTPQYMSPEQALGMTVDARTDLYSVGVVLYESITGRRPFEGRTMSELLQKHVAEVPQPPSSHRASVPGLLDQVVMRALAKDARQRFASAVEMRMALERAMLETGLTAGGVGVAASVATPLRTGASGTEVGHSVLPTRYERNSFEPGGVALPGPYTAPGPTAAGVPAFTALRGAPPAAPHAEPGAIGHGAVSPGAGYSIAYSQLPHGAPNVGQGPSAFAAGYTPAAVGAPMPTPGPRSSGLKAPLLVMLGCAGLGVVVAFVLAGMWFLSRGFVAAQDRPEVNAGASIGASSPPGLGAAAAVAEASPPPAAPAPDELEAPRDSIDLKSVDVGAYLPKALALAREEFSDAEFLRLDANGLRPDGTVDVTAFPSNYVLYRFRSPSRSQPPGDFPKNVEYTGPCLYYVGVYGSGVTTHVVDNWKCNDPLLPLPRCIPTQVWKKAITRGAATGNVVGQIGFWADASGKGRWHLSIPPYNSFFPDNCGELEAVQKQKPKSKTGPVSKKAADYGY